MCVRVCGVLLVCERLHTNTEAAKEGVQGSFGEWDRRESLSRDIKHRGTRCDPSESKVFFGQVCIFNEEPAAATLGTLARRSVCNSQHRLPDVVNQCLEFAVNLDG